MTRDSSVLSLPPAGHPGQASGHCGGGGGRLQEEGALTRIESARTSTKMQRHISVAEVTGFTVLSHGHPSRETQAREISTSGRSLLQYCFAPRSCQLAVPPAQR